MEYLIKISAILVLFYLCYKFLLNRETFFESNRLFLLLGLITAFILPLITIPKYIVTELLIIENSFVFNDTISQSIVVENSISFITIVTYIYIVGFLFFLGRFLFQFGSLFALLFNSTKQRVASFIYVITKNIISPFSFFNWIFFNPNQFSDKELEQIIIHEKVHAKQLHSIDILLAEITCIILWFNPLMWLYKKDLRQNLEFIADKNAQATSNCKKSYQHLLLKASVPNYQMAITNNFYNSLIKKRIFMLHKNKSKNRNQLKFLIVLPALALFLTSFNTKEIYIEAKPIDAETSTMAQESETLTKAIKEETIKTDDKPVITYKTIASNNNIVKPNTLLAQDIVAYFIESSFTNDNLDDVVAKLKAHGITLKIKGVKRNSDNEITAIKIDAKSDNSNANFSISNDSAIKPIKIAYNAKNNSISIGNTNHLIHDEDHTFTHKDGNITFGKSSNSDNVFVFSSGKHDVDHEVIEDENKIIIKKGNTVHELKKLHSDKDENVFVISGGKGETYDIIHADTLKSDGSVFKLKGNVKIKSSGKNKSIFISSGDDHEVIEIKGDKDEDGNVIFIRKDEDGNIVQEQVKAKGNSFIFESEDGKIFKTKSSGKGNSSIWVDKDEHEGKTITKIGKNGGTLLFTSDDDKDPLIIVDGKEVKNKKLKDMDPDTIKSINVLKGESVEKKYGKKGKDGVIEITLKKKKD